MRVTYGASMSQTCEQPSVKLGMYIQASLEFLLLQSGKCHLRDFFLARHPFERHFICATFQLRDLPAARRSNCATFQLRDIPSARHPSCATFQLRDISTARYFICATSQLRDNPFARLFNCATSRLLRDYPFARLFFLMFRPPFSKFGLS